MHFKTVPERLTEARTRALEHVYGQYGAGRLKQTEAGPPVPAAFNIALSREAGTYGAAIAREVGNRLGWPVYDRELLEHIANDLGVRGVSLESMDERHVSWLNECLAGFSWAPAVSQPAYVRHLVETLLSLAARGHCVIVGRGATKVLPLATTLRVRVVAPLKHRIEAVGREHGISPQEAARKVDATDRERDNFVREHFLTDPKDPTNYDLVLNVARFRAGECADLIIAALDRLQGHRMADPARAIGATAATSGS